jgi:hypothetical protein
MQPANTLCVPASLDNLLNLIAPGRASTDIEGLLGKVGPKGIDSVDASGFISDNLNRVGFDMVRGDLDAAIASGQPFMAFVDEGHAVTVSGTQTVGGETYLTVLDPAKGAGAYMQRYADFDGRVVDWATRSNAYQVPLDLPTVWGKPNK